LRVFDGGDCKYLPAMSDGVIAKHDNIIESKKEASGEEKNNLIKKSFKSNKLFLNKLKNNISSKSSSSSKTIIPPPPPLVSPTDTIDEDGEFEYPWDDDYDYYD
tara:strand:+ start:45 stop:356 length:312 start_codon:yes stop_codon:yes gene_type:complete